MEKVLQIPRITNNTIKYFVDDEFAGYIDTDQLSKIRLNILEYIIKNKDVSILNRFYFIGHKDSNDKQGEEIKITMDVWGNFSNMPWEMNHLRRSLMNTLKIEQENSGLLHSLESNSYKD